MPNITYPHKKRPGYVTARRCTAPCGGWVVLLDRRGGGPEGLTVPVKQTGRWILLHEPSLKWAGLTRKEDAMEHLEALAKGEDALELLPKTVKAPEGHQVEVEAGDKGQGTGESGGKPLSPGSEEGGTRARGGDAAPDPVVFQRELLEKFTAARIATEIEAGLSAVKAYVIGKGENATVETVDDHQTRVKYLDLLLKYRIGTAQPRQPVKDEVKKVSMTELEEMCLKSPAARRALRAMIDRKEKEAALVAVPTAPPQNKEAGDG